MSRTINSPGVEINEKDLSLRISNPVGTSVVIPGFATQGPIGEPILVTTISEFETIFGTPATPAERYFYYSMKEVLNSNATCYSVRLPYGGEAGVGFVNSYSALFYTMTPDVSGWVIGKPINQTLSLDDYTKLVRGDFSWGGLETRVDTLTGNRPLLSTVTFSKETSATGLSFALANDLDGNVGIELSGNDVMFTMNLTANYVYTNTVYVSSTNAANVFTKNEAGDIFTNAGFFLLNSLQTAINEIGEGYYVGVSTNDAATTPAFDSIKRLTSLNAASGVDGSNYFNIPQNRLEFTLEATKEESDRGVTSVSETLEKVGFQAYETKDYGDHLSFGVYKIRRSLSDASKLTLASTEKYLGSLDANRKITSTTGGNLQNAFIEDLVNTGSASVNIIVNPAVSRYQWSESSTAPTKRVTVAEEAKALFPVGVYAPNTIAIEKAKQIGNVPLKLARALRPVENTETYTIDVVIDAGLSTIYSSTASKFANALGNFNDELYTELEDTGGFDQGTVLQNWKTVAQALITFAQDARKDCIAIVDPPRSIFVVGRNTKILDIQQNSFTVNIYDPLQQCFNAMDSNYGATYANWVQVNDVFSSKKFWCPFSGYAAGVIARSDTAANAWAAPAGFNRGGFSNCLDLAFNPNQKQRDRLYDVPANPVVFFQGDGFAVFGQKTLQNKPTAFDRINVRRLFLALERSVAKTIRYFVFEPNTDFTRQRIVNTIAPAFSYAKNTNGLYDYLIVCDDRNNSANVIDNNELVLDIYLKPVRSAEFILVNFIATRTGQSFSELI